MLARLKIWAKAIKRDVIALWLAGRDPRVPLLPKVLAALVAAYALSPIDLIPDFIPVIGYLDEIILLPLAIAGLVKMIDPSIMAEHRAAAEHIAARPSSPAAATFIVLIWIAFAAFAGWWIWNAVTRV